MSYRVVQAFATQFWRPGRSSIEYEIGAGGGDCELE